MSNPRKNQNHRGKTRGFVRRKPKNKGDKGLGTKKRKLGDKKTGARNLSPKGVYQLGKNFKTHPKGWEGGEKKKRKGTRVRVGGEIQKLWEKKGEEGGIKKN